MDTLIFSQIEPWFLISLGICLLVFEMLITTFVVVWFGISLIIVGVSSYYINYESGFEQLVIVSILSLLLIWGLKNKFTNKFLDKKDEIEICEDFFNKPGIGLMVEKYMVKYNGTYFYINPNIDFEIKEGMEVNVISVENNIAKISKREEYEKVNNK